MHDVHKLKLAIKIGDTVKIRNGKTLYKVRAWVTLPDGHTYAQLQSVNPNLPVNLRERFIDETGTELKLVQSAE